jgi:hypothetical protein
MLDINFLLSGKAQFEIKNPSGDIYRFKVTVNNKRGRDGETNKDIFFVNCINDADGVFKHTYMGHFKAKHYINQLNPGQKGINSEEKVVKVFKWAVNIIAGQIALPDGYSINHIGKCGCCGRRLTDDFSKAIGLGPVCIKKTELSMKQLKLKTLLTLG